MAVPDSLSAWRDFVTQQLIEPDVLDADHLTTLTPEDKADHDEARFAWIGADVVVDTKDIAAVTDQVRLIRARLAAKRSTAGRALAISGRAGVGKSTVAMLLGKKHEGATRRKLGIPAEDLSVAPVIYLVVPPGCTPKMLMSAVARWIGLPVPRGWDAPTITDHVVAVLRELKTSMIIVDEVHNLKTNKSAGAEAASTLKVFTERLDAAVIFCGIDLLNSDLLAGEMGRQIRARTKVYDLRTYGFGSTADREAWAELVEGMEELLPLAGHQPGSLSTDEMSTYLWNRTGGSIGSLRNLLGDAAISAILSGAERIDRAGLDEVILDQEAVRASATTQQRTVQKIGANTQTAPARKQTG